MQHTTTMSIHSVFTPASRAHFSVRVFRSQQKTGAPACRGVFLIALLPISRRRDCTGCRVGIVDKVGCCGGVTRWTAACKSLSRLCTHGKGSLNLVERRHGEGHQESMSGISPVCLAMVPLCSACLLGARNACNYVY